jgi:hypothetical protein
MDFIELLTSRDKAAVVARVLVQRRSPRFGAAVNLVRPSVRAPPGGRTSNALSLLSLQALFTNHLSGDPMLTRQVSVAVLLLALTASVSAQEGTQDFRDQVLSTRSRAEVLAELAQVRATGLLNQAGETYGSIDSRSSASVLTRAEVLADLQLWTESGLAALTRGETYDAFSPAYRLAEARYRTLRSSPRYAELVQQIAERRGEVVASMAARTGAQ